MSADAQPVVSISHLSKRYTRDLKRSLRYGVYDICREMRRNPRPRTRLRPGEFLSLDDVSLTVGKGEALAVLGANGAGKSTLLKILHGLIKPDAGQVRIRGRVGALIELGAGFDPILTGRENIAIQGHVVGLNSREIAEYTERVVDFAELEHAIDTPIRYYSSGMSARLAFSVAAQMKADLMLVDEVLAVGDLAFQRKCIANLLHFIDGGGTVILVSHSVHQMQAVCSQGLLLSHGREVYNGDLATAIGLHLESQREVFTDRSEAVDHSRDPVRVLEVKLTHADGGAPRHGEPADFVIRYDAAEAFDVLAACSVWSADSLVCIAGSHSEPMEIEAGIGELRARVESLPMLAGAFTLRAAIVDKRSLVPLGMLGFADPPATVTVDAERDRYVNALEAANQLMKIEATWAPVAAAVAEMVG